RAPRSTGAVEQGWMQALGSAYMRVLAWAIRYRVVTVGVSVLVLGAALASLYFIGTEFMPRLDEGSILVETRKLPGVSLTESITGVKADLAIKVFGENFRVLDNIGQQVLHAVSGVQGAADEQMEITSGVAELSIRPDRSALARYGLNVTDVEEAVGSGGSGD